MTGRCNLGEVVACGVFNGCPWKLSFIPTVNFLISPCVVSNILTVRKVPWQLRSSKITG